MQTAQSEITISRRDSTRNEAGCPVVWVRGEHDASTSVQLAVAIAWVAGLDGERVLVDLSAVTFMDASIVATLVNCRDTLHAHGNVLELRAASPTALRVLERCRLDGSLMDLPAAPADLCAPALGSWVEVPVAERITTGGAPQAAPEHVRNRADVPVGPGEQSPTIRVRPGAP